ncbi:MAG: group II intron reverse transcriptase domain-containing protein [Planctomycetes bacterium]|nr:group II intron reverse transcriptase domain-containing protein [Planctomycetota bacterium]
MRRIGDVWDEITSFHNLCRAAHRAAAGKRAVAGVARFLDRLEPEALRLQRELRGRGYRPGRPVTFVVRDPKVRQITAAPFRDRVVHHALIDVLEPHFDRVMVPHSFACRRGKGQHRALRWAQRLVRRHGWFLKLDVQGFFPSLSHDVVLATLRRLVEDRLAFGLCETIVRAGDVDGRGLPIGHLTSQWFANLVLDRLDHWLVDAVGVPGYVRYMDDFVLFGDDKAKLRGWLGEVGDWLAARGLVLKDRATSLAPVTQGLPFLGFRLYRGLRRLRPENLRRARARLRQRAWQFRTGQLDEARVADCTRSVLAWLAHGNTLALRRGWFAGLDTAVDRWLLQPRQPRRQLQRRAVERAVGEPQQERPFDPQQQPGPAPRQDVTPPDPGRRRQARPGRAP